MCEEVECEKCNGLGQVICERCGGTGILPGFATWGAGNTLCEECLGSGFIDCDECEGTGYVEDKDCDDWEDEEEDEDNVEFDFWNAENNYSSENILPQEEPKREEKDESPYNSHLESTETANPGEAVNVNMGTYLDTQKEHDKSAEKPIVVKHINSNIVDKITYEFHDKKVTTYNKSGYIVSHYDVSYDLFIKYVNAESHYSFRLKHFKDLKSCSKRPEKIVISTVPLSEVDPNLEKKVIDTKHELMHKQWNEYYPTFRPVHYPLHKIISMLENMFADEGVYWDEKEKIWMKKIYK